MIIMLFLLIQTMLLILTTVAVNLYDDQPFPILMTIRIRRTCETETLRRLLFKVVTLKSRVDMAFAVLDHRGVGDSLRRAGF